MFSYLQYYHFLFLPAASWRKKQRENHQCLPLRHLPSSPHLRIFFCFPPPFPLRQCCQIFPSLGSQVVSKMNKMPQSITSDITFLPTCVFFCLIVCANLVASSDAIWQHCRPRKRTLHSTATNHACHSSLWCDSVCVSLPCAHTPTHTHGID